MEICNPNKYRKPQLEQLEDRQLLSIFAVTNFGDNGGVNPAPFAGTGTLRQAIIDANANPGADEIRFKLAGSFTITVATELPTLTDNAGVLIDGYSQMGTSMNTLAVGDDAVLLIELSGASAGPSVNGLNINSSNNTIQGLVINRFSASGIRIANASGNVIQGNYIGTDVTGTAARANALDGIALLDAGNNTIGGSAPSARNVISANTGDGVFLSGNGASGNLILGNYIGTQANGTLTLGNQGNGVFILTARNNTVGGTAAGARNVISGNRTAGVFLFNGSSSNVVLGNYIGTDANGTADLGNTNSGISLTVASNNTIGGSDLGSRNVISGNNTYGIEFSSASNNVIQGNFIGTQANGTAALGNSRNGIEMSGPSVRNTIGGTVDAARNVISGNNDSGIDLIGGTGNSGNVIWGNFIGTQANGTAPLGNTFNGVFISGSDNTVGGTIVEMRNVISGNQTGVRIDNSTGNVVAGNFIGTDVSGTRALGNSSDGVLIAVGARANTVGGLVPTTRNIISGNDGNGIEITSNGTSNNVVVGNFIGTDVNGTVDLGNGSNGVLLSSVSNTVGGTSMAARNVISGNDANGITINGSNNLVLDNYIGTQANGSVALGNTSDGVFLNNAATGNTIGGSDPGAFNVISGNTAAGVHVLGAVSDNLVLGNLIGTSFNGTADLGNNVGLLIDSSSNLIDGNTPGGRGMALQRTDGTIPGGTFNRLGGNGTAIAITPGANNNRVEGVFIGDPLVPNDTGLFIGSSGNTVGGTTMPQRNVISANRDTGLMISGVGASNNVVVGNFIGTDVPGTAALANSVSGVIIDSARDNTVGGTAMGARNVISGNSQVGLQIINAGATGNVVLGNFIGVAANGSADLGNGVDGVFIGDAARNTVGGTVAEARNIISGNNGAGVEIFGTGSSGNVVLGNFIGTAANGIVDVGNGQFGVLLTGGARANKIGDSDPSGRNVISGNDIDGIRIENAGPNNSSGNVVLGNFIGTQANGTVALANAQNGIRIESASSNTIGGGNVISGNGSVGILLNSVTNTQLFGNYIGAGADGSTDLGNVNSGIQIMNGGNITIGGTTAPERNVISGNGDHGINFQANPTGVLIQGNYIGLTADGEMALANGSHGIAMGGSANTIGGTAAGARNVISSNLNTGIVLTGNNHRILGNYIGTDAAGTADFGNTTGMSVGGTGHIIGGTVAGSRNVISGNGSGISLSATGVLIAGNYIGTDFNGTAPLGNVDGVFISGGTGHTVGGTTASARNVISGNGNTGVVLGNPGTSGNVILGNFIGTDFNGTADLGNSGSGVQLQNSATGNTIGGTDPGSGVN